MTREDITRMARKAGFVGFDGENKCLREFAALVAAAEREECAKECDIQASWGNVDERFGARQCSHAIRSRGKEMT